MGFHKVRHMVSHHPPAIAHTHAALTLTHSPTLQTDKVKPFPFPSFSLCGGGELTTHSPSRTARPSDTYPELRRDKPQAALQTHNAPRALAHRPRQHRIPPRRGPPSRLRRRRSADTPGARHRRPQRLRALPILGLQVHRATLFRRLPKLLSRDVRPRPSPTCCESDLLTLVLYVL